MLKRFFHFVKIDNNNKKRYKLENRSNSKWWRLCKKKTLFTFSIPNDFPYIFI